MMDDSEIELDYQWTTDNEEQIHVLTQPECDSTSHTTQPCVGLHDSSSPASMTNNTKKRGLTDSDSVRLVNILSHPEMEQRFQAFLSSNSRELEVHTQLETPSNILDATDSLANSSVDTRVQHYVLTDQF